MNFLEFNDRGDFTEVNLRNGINDKITSSFSAYINKLSSNRFHAYVEIFGISLSNQNLDSIKAAKQWVVDSFNKACNEVNNQLKILIP